VTMAPHVARRLLRGSAPLAPVHSTLDAALQREASAALRQQLVALRSQNVHDGAVLVVDNVSGDVLAYVGGSGDLSSGRYVDAVVAPRQAGSTLKPFLYALTFDRRLLTPASLIEDSPLEIPVFGGLYRPENYDEQFHGLVSARTALAGSLNIPAVRTLALVGVDEFTEQLRRLGFSSLNESGDFYGPSLALGSADVSLWELVNAYRTLANGGIRRPLHLTLGQACPEPCRRAQGERNAGARAEPRSAHAEPVEARAVVSEASVSSGKQDWQQVYSAAATFLVSDILADRESRSVTFGLESLLATRFWTAVKTGTSKSMRDNWCVGYSRRYTVGVWVGNLSGAPMHNVSGMSGAAPVWLDIMSWLQRDEDSFEPEPPAGVVTQPVTFPANTETARREWFVAGTAPSRLDTVHLAASRPRIVTPASGTIIALDPDIPRAQQRVAFSASGQTSAARWNLDGIDAGAAKEIALWPPHPGAHRLVLADDREHILDAVTFVVRGGSR